MEVQTFVRRMTNIFRRIFRDAFIKSYASKLSCKLHSRESREKPKQRFFSFLLTHYVNLVKSYEQTFPTAAKLYQTFSTGIKLFKDDGILLFKAYKKVNIDGIDSLTRKELEIYYEMPKNMIKVAPIIVIGTGLPFGVAVFALGCMFPKKTLSHHFWSEVQKNEFALFDHKKRLQLYEPILSSLQLNLKHIKCPNVQHHMATVLEGLQKGVKPTVEDILLFKPLFEEYPYSLRSLGSTHTRLLIQLHGLHRGLRRKMRLENFGALVHAMDLAVLKEGGVEKLKRDELNWIAFFRGLNPINMEDEDIGIWFKKWLLISKELNKDSYSLLLHCPVLLAYSEPTNTALLKR